jgi:hypothetical protein
MASAPIEVIAPSAVYGIGGRRYDTGAHDFADAVAQAHARQQRPLCMCQPDGPGVTMYVARLAGTTGSFIVKRMPETGSQHAPCCPSYEPPAGVSGLGQVLGQAITEDPASGETTLKLDFPLSRLPSRSQLPPAAGESDSVSTSGTKLSLRGLLHYLWDQAELTRWHPGFAGKRTWATVRRHLLTAAEHMVAKGSALRSRLYVPEPFSVDERDAINGRRLAQWRQAVGLPGKPQHLLLLIGEVKEITRARYGAKAVVKHVPDQAFAVDEQLYRRLGRRFEQELALWGASDDVQMVMIATFAVGNAGVPTIVELSLMPVTRQWIPIEDGLSKQLIDRLAAEGRSFIKGLRYNLARDDSVACAVLTDCGEAPVTLHILGEDDAADETLMQPKDVATPAWVWRGTQEPIPELPGRAPVRPVIA